MNINQVKAFTWLVSATLVAGLSYYVFDFISHKAEMEQPKISREEARDILESAEMPEVTKLSVNDARSVERAFLELNWTGERPPEVVEAPVVDDTPKAPIATPMDELVQIQMLQEDLLNPERGRAYIAYLAAANVVEESTTSAGLSIEVRVGDRLSEPHQYAKVKSITVKHGITFTFDDESRPDQNVMPLKYDSDIKIHVVSSGEAPIEADKINIPRINRDVWRPERTTMTKQGNFVIGSEDQLSFAEDYGGILAREVVHSRHRNPKTGKYDGIELKSVAPGGRMAAHGAQSGDIIKSINGHPVTSTAQAITFVKNNQDKYSSWEVVVENKGKERTVTYESPEGD